MRKTGKILSLILAVAVMFTTVAVTVSAGQVSNYEKTLYASRALTETNIDVWSSYVFATNTYGVEILDVRTGEVAANWSATNIKSAISSTASTFVPGQIAVNNDYIVITSTTNSDKAYIAVFENEGVFSSSVPEAIATLGLFNTPVTYLDGDNLVVFDLTADGTVNNATMTIAKNEALCWNIELSRADEFDRTSADYTQVAVSDMIDSGCSKLLDMGKYDYLWKQMDVSDGYAYAVTYNAIGAAPYKAIILHKVDIETMNHEKLIAEDGHATGLMAEVDPSLTLADLSNAKLALKSDPAKYMMVPDIGVANFLIDPIDSEKSYFYFLSTGFNKISEITDDVSVKNGSEILTVELNGQVYDLTYVENDSVYDRGTISVKDGYSYLVSNILNSTVNRLWAVRESDGTVVKNEELFSIGNKNGWQTSVIVGERLVGFLSGVNYSAAAIDISDPENIPNNNAENILMENAGVMFNGNQYAKAVLSSDRIYYPLANGNGVGVIKADVEAFSAEVNYREDSYPVIIYGDCSVSDEVTVTINGEEYTTETQMGIYTMPIYSILPDTYTAEVSAGGYSETVEFTTNVPEKIEVGNIGTGSRITADITNNTNTSANGSEILNVIVASYDENGNMISCSSKKLIAPYGKTSPFRSTAMQSVDSGCIKLFVLNGEEPLCQPIVIENGEAAQEENPVIIGYNPETAVTVTSNLLDKNALISGKSIIGNSAMIKIAAGDMVVMYDQITCDENGEFEYEYDFSDDGFEGIYTVTVTASNAASVVREFASVDDAVVDDVFDRIEGMSGSQLLSHLEANPDDAEVLGINLDNSDFVKLSSARQNTVMDAVMDRVNDGYRNGITTTFLNAIESVMADQEEDDMLLELNKATKNEIGGLLETNREVYGISDDVWEDYQDLSNSKKSTVHSKMAKYEIDSLDEISDYLKKAIKAAKEDAADDGYSSGPLGGGNASGNGGKNIAVKEEVIDPYTPVQATELFNDLGSVPWAKDSINALATAGIVDGVGNRLFDPNGKVTREQFIKMLVLGFNLTNTTDDMSFGDVKESDWYYEYVNIAYAAGITTGDDQGNFGAGKPLTREDAAVFVKRTVEALEKTLPSSSAATDFSDAAEIAAYAQEAVSAMQKAGIINGMGDGTFAPKGSCTRAMAAKIINELLAVVK